MAEQQAETYLYKLEAELADRLLTVVVVAQSDERAFSSAENNILRHTVAPPQIKQLSLVEKKPLGRQGVGYVIETSQF
ncbi:MULTISPECIES: DUF3906 family protein [Brevibacillus]|jgi:hypothetical protein|uniref:DUF3906 family protein n=1 Tax=Brevibacillus thermoruber TaxID=33942 RepID=A0A9X3TRV2_9BACL|nr:MULTISPECIES: DUF3906 family protein [Brevibacillus]MDA5109702.1 DUF3906 family protein [Brevibacillus thermoruber]TRY27109.1 DUF3906 family protein [Brevibacillus sp. LEMMJ03]UYZ14581.1 DUF3906 family protein [Brevibacillus sp. WF146]